MDNGFASELFEIKRGVRQGDPLSLYLFIIALEIVNGAIRKNKEIKGITLGKNEIKLSIFADDLTIFFKSTKSFRLFSHAVGELWLHFRVENKRGKNGNILVGKFACSPRGHRNFHS